MFNFATLFPFALVAIAYALPPAGTYNIVNRIMSPDGKQLAITFAGKNTAVTLQPLAVATNQNQIFNLQLFNGTAPGGMTITSRRDPSQQLAPDASVNGIIAKAPVGATYNIMNTTAGFIIGNNLAKPDHFWFPTNAVEGAGINWNTLTPGPGDARLNWVLIPNPN